MMTRRFVLVAGAAVLAAGTLAFAQALNAKPGLWEVTTTMNMAGMPQMPANMPDMSQMPPEAQERMKAAMGMMQGKPIVTRTCMTPEKISSQMFTDKRAEQGNCTQTTVSRTATSQEIKIECSGDAAATGTLKFTATDPENVRGEMKMNVTGGRGAGMGMSSTFTAKWIGANCGDVK